MKTNDIGIVKLLENIHAGKIQLPDFQRSWVWDDIKIRKLIAGITNSYPIGALMFLSYGNPQIHFKCRTLEGAPVLNCDPEELILDGQQRLTAIYLAMYAKEAVKTKNKGKEIALFYYIDIEKAINPSYDRLDAIIAVSKDKTVAFIDGKIVNIDLSSPEQEFQNKMFPLNIIFDNSKIRTWQRNYDKYYFNSSSSLDEYTKFDEEVIGKLPQYQIPVISMEKETPLEAVCQVFENVNTGSVALTVFELVTASFATKNFNLREDWENRRKKYFLDSILNDVSATDFLTACVLLSSYRLNKINGQAVSNSKKDILKFKSEDYISNADDLVSGFIEAAKFLKEERIFENDYLPYPSQLIPLAVICTILTEKNLLHTSDVREKVRQWYWCGVFGGFYSAPSEGWDSKEVKETLNWICDSGVQPTVIQDMYFSPMRLTRLQTRNSAAYRGFMAIILKNNSKDFISGRAMDFTAYEDESIDIHHIFPKKYCERQSYPKAKYNSILNKTPISSKTNRIIGSSSPSVYLKKITQKVTKTNLKNFLQSHWIDYEDLQADKFDDFIAHRATCLLNAVEKVTGKKILGRDTDEVIKFFGRAI